jgi:hypothetical protein
MTWLCLRYFFFRFLLLFRYHFSSNSFLASSNLQIHEHVPPLRAEAGTEFVDKLMAQGQKNKRSPSDDGSSQAPPSKRFRTEELGEKKVGVRRYARKQMPTAAG